MYQEVEVNGEVIEFPESMSDDEISAVLQKQFKQQPEPDTTQPIESPAQEEAGNFWLDKIKQGIADMAESILPDPVLDEVLGLDMKEYQLEDGSFDVKRYERDRYAAKEEATAEFLGYKGIKPESKLQGLLGEGLRGTVAEGPLAVAGGRKVTGTLAELLHSYTANVLGQIGGETGAMTAKALGGGEMAQQMAASVGGVAAGSTTVPARSGTRALLELGTQAVKERQRVIGGAEQAADNAATYTANSELRRIIDDATQAQPDLDKTIDLVKDLQAEVPGLIVPPFAALADNPIYRENTDYLLRTNPKAFAEMQKSLREGLKAVEARKEALFGQTGAAVDAQIRALTPNDYTITLKNARKRIEAVDTQLAKIADKVRTSEDAVSIGENVKNLMKTKEKAVQARLSKKYDALLNKADANGVEMPATGISNVYNTYRDLRSADVFKVFPGITNRLKNRWGPKEVENPEILGPNGEVLSGGKSLEFSPAGVREIDSLKKEINAAIRNTSDSNSRRILNTLKDSLNAEVAKLGDFGEQYRAIDRSFYEELGIPRNKSGLKQLDSARFMTQAGTYLSKPEQARDFLSFVGEAGIPVVRDAIILNMQNSGVYRKDGLIDPTNLGKFLAKNERLISTVPGLREELTNARNLVNRLTNTKADIDNAYKAESEKLADNFYRAFNSKNLSGVVNDILRSPSASAKYLNDLKNFTPETRKMVQNGVRAEMLRQGMASNRSMYDFIKDNRVTFEQWFGKTYTKDINAIAQANDFLSKVDVENMRFAIDYRKEDALSKRLGISWVQTQSILRDRIAGAATKAAIIGSKMNVNLAQAKRDEKVMQLLMDPKALEGLRKTVEDSKFKIKTPEVITQLAYHLNNAVSRGAYFGLEGGEAAAEEYTNQQGE